MSTRGLYVLVKVLSVHRNYAFPCCIRCSTRIRTEDDENIFLCSKCEQKYDKKQIRYRYRINMTVSDRTQVSNVTVFGNCLEHFFGTSATHFKRFVEGLSLEKDELPFPVDQLVHQCIEQCFVGSMIRLCFRGLHPRLTDSQASSSSPTHLKNILTKIQDSKLNYLSRQQQNTSHLLASYMSRPEDTEKNATVFELLKEYLEFFRCSKSVTPSSGCTSGSYPMSCSVPQCNRSLQSNSRLHYKGFGGKSSEVFNPMVSPLVLSCETRESNQSPTTYSLDLNREVDQIDSEVKSQARTQSTATLDNSSNRTALMLVSLLNLDTSDECIDGSSTAPTNDKDIIHDTPGSSCDTYKDLKCLNDPTEKNSHDGHCSEIERTHEELAYFDKQSKIDKPESIHNATENEKQQPQSTCSWGENDHSEMNDQKDMDFFPDEDLSSFFVNLSLDFEINKGVDKNCQHSKEEKSFIEDQPWHRLDDAHEFPDHLASEFNSLQEKTDQMSISFAEDLLSDQEFSNFSFMYDYEKPRPPVSKNSAITSSQGDMTTDNEVVSCAVNSSSVERAVDDKQPLVYSKGKDSPNGRSRKMAERIMGTSQENGCLHSDSVSCYSSTDKLQDNVSLDYSSKHLGTPLQLSFQSLVEQTSTPVLFDDSHYSTESRLKLYRSLSFPKALQPSDVMERDINMNNHSTPMDSECTRKFKDLSGDLRNYSGLFLNDRNRKKRVSVQNKMTPGVAGQESWNTDDQICPESPLLFSFSSTERNSCGMTPDIQQDSLLCASLLDCSYLK